MKKELLFYEIVGLIVTWITGALLHFLYGWTGQNSIAAIFAPVNESTWEHLKLLFFPMLIYSIVEFILLSQKHPNFIVAKTVGITAGLLSIVVLFYTYTGIIGTNFLWADILIFIIGVGVAYYISWTILNQKPVYLTTAITYTIFLFLLILAFLTLTANPYKIALFKDPVSGTYGINREL